MKKYFRNTIVFIGLSLICSVLVFTGISLSKSMVLRTNIKSTTGGYGASLLRYREAKRFTRDSIDVLFCGSSHCYRGFDIRIFSKAGISSFNMGSSAQTPLNTFYLLKDFTLNIHPSKIVLEVYWNTLQSKGVESAIDLISNTPLSYSNFKMGINTYSFEPVKTWFYQKIHRIKFPLDQEGLLPSKNDIYISGGFVETKRDTNKYVLENTNNQTALNSLEQLVYIDSIYKYCKANHIELILINTPVYELVVQSISNYDEKIEEIKQFASYRNLSFIDFNSVELYQYGNWNPRIDWYDDTHLTQRGVVKFNTLFIEKYGVILKD